MECDTQKLRDLAMTTPYSLSDLRMTKKDFNLTDYGIEQCVSIAMSHAVHPADIAYQMAGLKPELKIY